MTEGMICEGQSANHLVKTIFNQPYNVDSNTNLSLGEYNKDFAGVLSKSAQNLPN